MPSGSDGRLVRVAYAQNAMEGEMIKGLLFENGIPSMMKRELGGLALPHYLMPGPCEIFVPESAAEAAREVLAAAPEPE